MDNPKNPEDNKPSFFSSSDDEQARSWPPADSYETEDKSDAKPASDDDFIDDLLTEIESGTSSPDEDIKERFEIGGDYVDMLFTDFGGFDGAESAKDEAITAKDDFLVPITKKEEAPVEEPIETKEEVLIELSPVIKENQADALDEILEDQRSSPLQDPFPELKSDQQAPEPSFVQEESSSSFNADDLYADDFETETLPFRTYSKQDYNEELIPPDVLAEEDKKKLPINKNVLVVLMVLLLVGGYYGFKALTTPKYTKQSTGRKRRPPKKEKKVLVSMDKELMPVWDLTNQKREEGESDSDLIKTLVTAAGRLNPFAVPDSIIAELRKTQELEIIKKQKPKTYRRKAYRATLIGVLTSRDNTIALINQQEAVFDILEGTTKDKILKLAIKGMDKAKQDTLEMVVGSYIGPWKVTRIDSAKDALTDAKVFAQYNGQIKTFSLGKAEELGIFTESGVLDNLERAGMPAGDAGDEDLAADEEI